MRLTGIAAVLGLFVLGSSTNALPQSHVSDGSAVASALLPTAAGTPSPPLWCPVPDPGPGVDTHQVAHASPQPGSTPAPDLDHASATHAHAADGGTAAVPSSPAMAAPHAHLAASGCQPSAEELGAATRLVSATAKGIRERFGSPASAVLAG